MRPTNQPLTPKQKFKSTHKPEFQALVEGIFGRNGGVFFNCKRLSPILLDEFIQSDEVCNATYRFVREIMNTWETLYPGEPPLQVMKTNSIPAQSPEVSAVSIDATVEKVTGKPLPITLSPNPAVADVSSPHRQPQPVQPQGSAPLNPIAKPGIVPAGGRNSGAAIEHKAAFAMAANAKVGADYRAHIDGKDSAGQSVKVFDVRLPDGLGLSFDTTSGELHGTPSLAGDHKIFFQWRGLDGHVRSGECLLIVNANPRDLWQNIDADPSDPYFKPNEDCARIDTPFFKIAAASKRGRSHAHSGTCRDDDFFIHHDISSAWSVLVVADGAGGSQSSRKGAELAVKHTGGHLLTGLTDIAGADIISAIAAWRTDNASGAKPLNDKLYYLFLSAANSAVVAIDEEARAKSATYKNYSTTLLVAIQRKTEKGSFVASFWVGDGAIAVYGPKGKVRLMGTPDSGEYAGQTRFLDNQVLKDGSSIGKRISFGEFSDHDALILMTDGISDPRFETDNGLTDSSRWDALWEEMAPALSDATPEKKLVEWLDFFTPGHHDDRTIALLW
jgi:serine/threonine protein phosphatase PrpC